MGNPSTDEGKDDDDENDEGDGMKQVEQYGDDELVQFPAIFKCISFEKLFIIPNDDNDCKQTEIINNDNDGGDDNNTLDGGDENKNDNDNKVIDKINKHRFFFYGTYDQYNPSIYVFS